MDMKKVLFVCVHNSGRSQMAEAFFNQLGGKKIIASSAGTQPADQIDPVVAYVMREKELDISRQIPRKLTAEMLDDTDGIISMGCGIEEACPAHLVPMDDWGIEDPAGKTAEKVREIRDIIKNKVETLIKEMYLEAQLEVQRNGK
jgi:arsenate reductase